MLQLKSKVAVMERKLDQVKAEKHLMEQSTDSRLKLVKDELTLNEKKAFVTTTIRLTSTQGCLRGRY